METGERAEDFWRQTPRLLALILKGHANRARRDFQLLAWHAHTSASLERARRLPPLTKLINGKDRERVRRDPAELLSLARRWTAAVSREESNHEGRKAHDEAGAEPAPGNPAAPGMDGE